MKLENIKTAAGSPAADQPYIQVEAGLRTLRGRMESMRTPSKALVV